MIKKIDVLGIRLDNYTVRESIMQVESYLDHRALNTIECVTMKMLLEAESDAAVRDMLSSLDLAIIGEKEVLRAVGIQTMQRTRETESGDFSFEFFKRVERNKKSVFLLGETEEETAQVKRELLEVFPNLLIVGGYAVENCVGDLEGVINDMNAMSPDVILSTLPTPMQEHFFMEHRDKMNASIWYGVGADGRVRKRCSVKNFFCKMIYYGRLKNSMDKYQAKAAASEEKEEAE